jgi:hypothetical protein
MSIALGASPGLPGDGDADLLGAAQGEQPLLVGEVRTGRGAGNEERMSARSLSVSKRAELVRLWRLAMLATKSQRIVTIEDRY